jgi:tetratricopeptide (TPR) repeat protein
MIFIVLTLFAACCGCASRQVATCTLPGDNAQLHYVAGMDLIEKGDYPAGRQRLERAIYCDADFSPAYDGLAIAAAHIAARTTDHAVKVAGMGLMENHLKRAYSGARNNGDRLAYLIAVIRCRTALGEKAFIESAEAAYRQAEVLKVDETDLPYYRGKEAIDYYMGLAYRKGQEFQEAKGRFEAVLNAKRDGKWNAPADRAWKETDRIVRAMAGITVSDLGRKIAVKGTVTRAELTTLLTHDFALDTFSPKNAGNRPHPVPADVASSPIRGEILAVLKWNLRGLEPSYDAASGAYLFNSARVVKRGEMALLLEDMVIRITGDEKIAFAYLGHEKSPFTDISPTSRFYNAAMNATTRGLMEGETGGAFRVDEPVSGADAVLALRSLQQKMKDH